MTINELYERLVMLRNYGHGDDKALIFDPDSMDWEEVSCLTYGGDDKLVKFYSDDLE